MNYATHLTICGCDILVTDAHLLDKYALCFLGDHCRLKIGSHVANMGDATFVFKIHCLTDISPTVGI